MATVASTRKQSLQMCYGKMRSGEFAIKLVIGMLGLYNLMYGCNQMIEFML